MANLSVEVVLDLDMDWVSGLRKSLRLSKAEKRVLRKIFGV